MKELSSPLVDQSDSEQQKSLYCNIIKYLSSRSDQARSLSRPTMTKKPGGTRRRHEDEVHRFGTKVRGDARGDPWVKEGAR